MTVQKPTLSLIICSDDPYSYSCGSAHGQGPLVDVQSDLNRGLGPGVGTNGLTCIALRRSIRSIVTGPTY